MKLKKTFFNDCYIFVCESFYDKRGSFTEIYNEKKIITSKKNLQFRCKQINFISSHQNSLRGMHFQKKPFSQKKILRVIEGKIFDVVLEALAAHLANF